MPSSIVRTWAMGSNPVSAILLSVMRLFCSKTNSILREPMSIPANVMDHAYPADLCEISWHLEGPLAELLHKCLNPRPELTRVLLTVVRFDAQSRDSLCF